MTGSLNWSVTWERISEYTSSIWKIPKGAIGNLKRFEIGGEAQGLCQKG